jgi:hypothetical protein
MARWLGTTTVEKDLESWHSCTTVLVRLQLLQPRSARAGLWTEALSEVSSRQHHLQVKWQDVTS